MPPPDVQQQFAVALDRLIARVRDDRSILAALLCGSLSHDTVWTKSDIDLVFITVDDRKVEEGHVALYADGLNVHAMLVPRTAFRQMVDGSLRNSFTHSFLTTGRLLYTHDPTIAALCATLADIGARDRQVQLLRVATNALPPIDKAHKWFVTRRDLEYTALWLLYAATPLAQMEVIGAGLLVDREVIPQAMRLNPSLFTVVYSHLLNTAKTRTRVQAALDAVDDYVAHRAPAVFAPILDYLADVGDIRSCRDLEAHFSRNFGIEGVTTACEYLAAQGLIGKASTATRLTRRSNVDVQELAFFYIGEPRL
jgi:uncharacterized protein